MSPSYELELVANLERAEESIRAAKLLLGAGHFDFAIYPGFISGMPPPYNFFSYAQCPMPNAQFSLNPRVLVPIAASQLTYLQGVGCEAKQRHGGMRLPDILAIDENQ